MNLTDVDDRIIQQSVAAGKSIGEYTEVYAQAFLDDSAALRLERPERVVKATDHIADMVALIQRLAAEGHTYESDGSVYFRIATFPGYGKLSHIDFSGILDRRPRRHGQVRQGERPRLRPLEGPQGRRALLG